MLDHTDMQGVADALERHPSVARAAALDVLWAGEPLVLAAVELEDFSTSAMLREYVAQQMDIGQAPPGIMIMESLPMRDGHPDIVAIEAEALERDDVYAEPPADDLEAMLADLWADSLGWRQIGVLDDFLDSGGDSLTAVTLLARIKDEFGVDIDVFDLMDSGTPRAVADILRELGVRVEGPMAHVSEVWRELLGRVPDTRRDFFAQGGNSLLATRLTARLNEKLDSALSHGFVYEHPGIRAQAAALAEAVDRTVQHPQQQPVDVG